jgi:hypothetical protein
MKKVLLRTNPFFVAIMPSINWYKTARTIEINWLKYTIIIK